MADGSYWTYTYDAKGQIVSGTKYDSTNKAIPGQAFNYAYDDIGNLTSEQRGMTEMQFDYTSNLVNQYTQRLVPGIIPVTGQASADSTVSVWLKNHGANAAAVVRPTRDGEYFKAAIPVNNSAANVTEAIEITAVKFNTTLDKDVVKTIDGNYTVPKTPQLFSYDDDGNMTGDGVWTYTWNGENQLIAIEQAGKTKLELKYDYQGRRTEKKVYLWVSNTWSLTKYLKFAYDGYKQIAEYDGTAGTMQKNYIWQPEATGQDVPLWLNNGTSTYYYIVDGNKNIRALADGTGALTAKYEYGPFGEVLSKYGVMADINPLRFSAEYFDSEIGLVYYNYRYYSPGLNRWISRDPIGEKGGKNLYGFLNNNVSNQWDVLGELPSTDFSKLQSLDCCEWDDYKLEQARRQQAAWLASVMQNYTKCKLKNTIGTVQDVATCTGGCAVVCVYSTVYFKTCMALCEYACNQIADNLRGDCDSIRDSQLRDINFYMKGVVSAACKKWK